MKRYNFHVPDEWPAELQAIRAQIVKSGRSSWFWQSMSVADLMRIAISATFGLADPQVHTYNDEIKKAINRVCKVKPWPKALFK